ncbi:sensor histidine kinase [Plantactinospora solaniradicis]|uniref:histidine kinase n=1 Tax=Plantactinospora solaniradicis TaxID=1723736 RepID=A0ABW1K049_9ACTN
MSRIAELYRRLLAWRWTILDVVLAAGLTLVSVQQSGDRGLQWWLFAVPMVTGLVVHRRWPMVAVLLTVAGALGHHLPFATGAEALDLAVPLTLFTLASSDRSRRVVAVTFGVVLLSVAGLSLLQPVLPTAAEPRQAPLSTGSTSGVDPSGQRMCALPAPGQTQVTAVPVDPRGIGAQMIAALRQGAGSLLVLALAYLLGENVRNRRIRLQTLERRALDLQHEQQQRIALATAAERARITRELHDVVAHGLSVMVVQAQGGAAALRRHPDRTEAALQSVIAAGRSSLAEMRRLLAVVRQDPAEDPELAPQPGVEALPDLVDRLRAAGTHVTLAVEGVPAPMPVSVDLSVYRIAQEALTNTLKHAGDGASATVRLGFRPDVLEIEVVDDGVGKPPPTDGKGNGLRGIRERVVILGGELTVGPSASGGFQVLARIPLRPGDR